MFLVIENARATCENTYGSMLLLMEIFGNPKFTEKLTADTIVARWIVVSI